MTQSSVHLQKGDYIKLKNLTIGYTLPAVLSKKVYAQNIRFFASGENLFTITGYEGMDPENAYRSGIFYYETICIRCKYHFLNLL